MAVLFPQLQFFDNNGDPLSLGKIYTYTTGTTTPKSTWTTAAESANHPNPVILDDEGRAEIWLSTDSEYRITIKSATDATIQGPIDNVTGVGIQLSSFSELASDLDMNGYDLISTSNADIIFSPHGTGDVVVNNDTFKVSGTATQSGRIVLGEDTDNGTNTQTIAAQSSITSNQTLTLPHSDYVGTTSTLAGVTSTSALPIIPSTTAGSLIFYEASANGSNSITFQAPSTITTNQTLTLPEATGTIFLTGGTDLPVSDGGTGVSTLTAYGPVIAGTTNTGAVQVVSPATSTMKALFSGGSAAIPVYNYSARSVAFTSSVSATEIDASGANLGTTGGVNCTLQIDFIVYPSTDGSSIFMRFFDATPTIVTANYFWQMIKVTTTTVAGAENTSDSKIDLTDGAGSSNQITEQCSGSIRLYTSGWFHGIVRNTLAAGANQTVTISGYSASAGGGVRLYSSSGNINGQVVVTAIPFGI